VETEDKDFSTPERRAGLERALAEIVSAISDTKIADYYRREFEQKVFEQFKRRAPAARSDRFISRPPSQDRSRNNVYSMRPVASVSSAVKNSLLAKVGNAGARRRKEAELVELLLEHQEIALSQTENLASIPFSDRVLDRFRHELLNLAASGVRLEKAGVENHLIRAGLGDLLSRFGESRTPDGHASDTSAGSQLPVSGENAQADVESQWLLAAAQLREMAEAASERRQAVERFNTEASEESWHEAHRLIRARVIPSE
jgi:DNA primase